MVYYLGFKGYDTYQEVELIFILGICLFWKTITKLNNSIYLSTKSVGDVLKKLIKKLCDFMECGMMK